MKFNLTASLTAFTIGIVFSADAIEPWADETLPVRTGLELWLDASRENDARKAAAPATPRRTQPVAHNRPLDYWHDASGYKRDVHQAVSGARPKYAFTPGGFVVRFDGKDDFLFGRGEPKSFRFATIFMRVSVNSNPGNLRGLLAFNKAGANDYNTGFNVDLGPNNSKALNFLNLEGNGFVGISNLMSKPVPFGMPHTIAVSVPDAESGIHVWVDSIYQGKRNRAEAELSLDEWTVGTRHFSNSGEPPFAQGFFDGDIMEILVYSRVFGPEETAQVEKYLADKYKAVDTTDRKFVPLVAVSNLPPVQMLVPGFSVRQLPVQLNNINCVQYRKDGKLVALGYDGNVFLLSDTDGDGLEDKATPFWNKPGINAPIGMDLTQANDKRGFGVFVASKGKVSLLLDKDRDDVADEEVIVAEGWKQLWHGVDALGVAVDKDGSVYFGLGTANFTDGYLMDKESGKATYTLKNERGTILKVAPDFSRREIFCTGIRFPVAMRINNKGDLFCSDQEGATWLPNGNPFDELLHIQKDRHYGFPPRHPKHLPAVIDEPSVFDYGPQHQSTCGFNFNISPNGNFFGPAWWKDDVLMAGYSRGKIWRTKLVETSAGYIGQSQLITSLNMLPADACVSPQGDLVITVHSGQPDWGSGPTGAGKIYKVSYADKSMPQPVLTWAANPTETCVEFDRPLDPTQFKDFVKQIKVTQGRYVAAGDQFEYWRPGYQVVQNQLAEPRYELNVHSAVLENDGRTLVVRTSPRKVAVGYAVNFPRPAKAPASDKELPQHAVTDVAHDLSGVEARWSDRKKTKTADIWIPHLNSDVARAFTEGSARHAEFWRALDQDGELKLRTQFDLWQMLRSATQPGSKLDYEYPGETVTLVFKSKTLLQVTSTSAKVERVSDTESRITVTPKKNAWVPIEATLGTSKGAAVSFEVSWFTAEDPRARALPLHRLFVPWATPKEEVSRKSDARVIPEIAGGNWLKGKKIFFGEKAACSKCHVMEAQGGKIGPDLSNLIHRDYASVMKDIAQPSAAINPDHVAYNVELKDGEALTGVLLAGNETELPIADATGKATTVRRQQIASMKPSSLSLMPEGLLQGLSPQEVKDLLTFLLVPQMQPATIEIPGEPLPRKRADFDAFLKTNRATDAVVADPTKPFRIVLCSGPKDHGPGEHDYPLWQNRWSKLLAMADGVAVETADKWPSKEQWATADTVVFYSNNPEWSAGKAPDLDAFLHRGGGVVYIHYAVDGHAHCDELAQRIGLAWKGWVSKFRHGPLDLKFAAHEVSRGFEQAHFIDESYWNLVGKESNIQLLASGVEEGAPRPLLWVREQNKGRVFVSIPGHYNWTFDDPYFRLLLLRGIAWTARQPVDRLSDLATIGARIAE